MHTSCWPFHTWLWRGATWWAEYSWEGVTDIFLQGLNATLKHPISWNCKYQKCNNRLCGTNLNMLVQRLNLISLWDKTAKRENGFFESGRLRRNIINALQYVMSASGYFPHPCAHHNSMHAYHNFGKGKCIRAFVCFQMEQAPTKLSKGHLRPCIWQRPKPQVQICIFTLLIHLYVQTPAKKYANLAKQEPGRARKNR